MIVMGKGMVWGGAQPRLSPANTSLTFQKIAVASSTHNFQIMDRRQMPAPSFVRSLVLALAATAIHPAAAVGQDLSLYGLTGCFAGVVGATSVTNGVTSGDCDDVASSTIRFGDVSFLQNTLTFERSTPPGAPGDQGTGDPLALGLVSGTTQLFSLGTFALYGAYSGGFQNAYLNFSFWFTDGVSDTPTFSYNDQLLLNYDLEGTNELWFDLPAARTYSIGGSSYEFAVSGLDANADCGGPQSTVLRTSLQTVQAELCGSLRYLDAQTVVPEPATLSLLASGLLGLGGALRGSRRRA